MAPVTGQSADFPPQTGPGQDLSGVLSFDPVSFREATRPTEKSGDRRRGVAGALVSPKVLRQEIERDLRDVLQQLGEVGIEIVIVPCISRQAAMFLNHTIHGHTFTIHLPERGIPRALARLSSVAFPAAARPSSRRAWAERP